MEWEKMGGGVSCNAVRSCEEAEGSVWGRGGGGGGGGRG